MRIYFDENDIEVKGDFKLLAAKADIPMSRRAVELMKLDIAYWKATGEILELGQPDVVAGKLSNQKKGDSKETNGHQVQQQAKATKPPKYHKTYKGQAGEDGDLDIWDGDGDLDIEDEDGDLDIWDEDINGDLQLSNQGNSQTNSYDFPQVKVTNPKRNHKRYKNKVGDLVSELDSTRVKVSFDGDIETFHRDEIEIVG